MEIIAGRYYKTRDGRKAYVAAVGNPLDADETYPVVGWLVGGSGPEGWAVDGRFNVHHSDKCDLVAEWVEPVSLTAELVLVKTSRGGIGIYPVNAMYASDTVVARKTITLTEGEGV